MSGKVMKLGDILASLDETQEKTAEETSETSKESKGKEELMASLQGKKSEKSENEEKTEESSEKAAAHRASPVDDLQKIASDLAAAEEEAIIKEAHLYGAAVADGFMARIQQYEKVASHLPMDYQTKQASEPTYVDDEGNVYTESEVKEAMYAMSAEDEQENGYEGEEKVAYYLENGLPIEESVAEQAEEMVKQAYYQGYQISHEDALEKIAQDYYEAGYNDFMEKAASTAYDQGYQDTMEKGASIAYEVGFEDTLEKSAQILKEAGEHEAVAALEKAAFESGYEDAMEKIAFAAYSQGYQDMNNLLSQAG